MAQAKKAVKPLSIEGNNIVFKKDSLGNRIPDYSFAGYRASEAPIPNAPIKVIVPLLSGDATQIIQNAIDEVSKLPQDNNGTKGAILLQPGTYKVAGSLHLHTSGVVLRGSGMGLQGTIIQGTGVTRETLIKIEGINNKQVQHSSIVTDSYVPVNSTSVTLENAKDFKPGQTISIIRPSTAKWIQQLGTDHFGGGLTAIGWKPGEHDLVWYRRITNISGNTISFDAPLTTAIDSSVGVAKVQAYQWQGLVKECGIENIQLTSEYDLNNPVDEDHRWMAITMENAADCWVRQITFRNFAGSAVALWPTTQRITVEDCLALKPVSEKGGWRRNTFFTAGQQTLFQRCYAEYSMHAFSTGHAAPGPNAFVQCEAYLPYSFSGGLQSWSSGLLMDVVNIDGQAINLSNRGQNGNGVGWNAANSTLWNCSASLIENWQPPGAQNWSFGSWAQFNGNGYWDESNNHLNPRSLFYAQLQQRLGRTVPNQSAILNINTNASSSPSIEQAAALTKAAREATPTLFDWILHAAKRNEIPTTYSEKQVKKITVAENKKQPAAKQNLTITKGILSINNQDAAGKRQDVQWWSGSIRSGKIQQARPHITRYVPGQTGTGLTDNLDSVVRQMKRSGTLMLEHNYGLWYDRRRDDHERIRRIDGDVWPPFYELPFARSGKETAWDGLSKYDLTKPNQWYWNRLRNFADKATHEGLILFHQHYFQHNILEAGAHYADFPWRTANNVNATIFPEPVPYAGDKRIFMDEQFYDTTNSHMAQLHRQYIRQCLSAFAPGDNVIHAISAEFTGPLHFVAFWLNVIAEYESETGQNVWVALSTTKDVQDAILANEKWRKTVDIIDIRYWHYQADGTAYAPEGGKHLAPRQHARVKGPKSSSAEQVTRAVSEYRKLYPDKAVIYSADGYDRFGEAVQSAGGSLPTKNASIKK